MNASKTEEFSITPTGDDKWQKCKLVGSLLDTTSDIERRKQAANSAYCKLKKVLLSKRLSLQLKLRVFRALVESIFLYNSEIWALTKTLENYIDVFQRKLLRNILGIRYSANNWLSNEDLYKVTSLRPWSSVIRWRRLSFFGHVCRLSDDTPAKKALEEALRPVKRRRGRAKTGYITTISQDLRYLDISIKEAMEYALDKSVWRQITARAMANIAV